VTTCLLITAVTGIGLLFAYISRTIVLVALSYLALRHSKPNDRKEILRELGPVFSAVEFPEPRQQRYAMARIQPERDTRNI
jgi:hypothetical protein